VRNTRHGNEPCVLAYPRRCSRCGDQLVLLADRQPNDASSGHSTVAGRYAACSANREGVRGHGLCPSGACSRACRCPLRSGRRKGVRSRKRRADDREAGSGAARASPRGSCDAGPHANDKANAELASLQPGFVPKDLVAALNDSVISFASGGAEVPASMTDFLQKAAADLKQLPKGHVVEIAGYTDSTGDEAFNVGLSQRRAEAVREALVKFGADPDMLIAKGYGSADPIASNDTPEGRRRNRRIEYHIVKTP
jgi:outer membrane protein OmpA-like peptidoglycan-associated protein